MDDCYANTQSAGQDLRFTTDEAGTTQIPFEVVSWDTTNKKGEVWVKRTLTYNADTDFYVWYGNSGASALAANDTYGSQNVWSDCVFVSHLGTTFVDATSNNLTPTNEGSSDAEGKIGRGRDFVASSSQRIEYPDAANLTGMSALTIQAWLKPDETQAETFCTTFAKDLNDSWIFTIDRSGAEAAAGQMSFRVENSSSTVGKIYTQTNVLDGTWRLFHGVWNGTTNLIYVNGSSEDSTSFSAIHLTSGTIKDTAAVMVVGARKSAGGEVGNPFDGVIDEVRVRASALSADWIATEYNNQNAPNTFITGAAIVGEEQAIGTYKSLTGVGL